MSTNEGSWGDLLSGKNAAYSAALSGGVALHAINIYIATTVLPSVVKDIGGLDLYAWNTTLFVVTSILGSALTAKLLAVAGSRAAYGVAAVLFILGSLTCALSPNMPTMLFGRALQGFGGGFLFALSYTMIYAVFDERLWPRAMALISGMWGVATLLGPAVGGIFAEMDAWRAAFGILVPVTLLYVVLVWLVLPTRNRDDADTASKLPIAQLWLLTGAVLAISAGSTSSDPFWNIAGVVCAAVLMWFLVRKEFTSETFVPYFLQTLHEQTPLVSGYLAALMAAGWTVSEVWSSGWKDSGIRRAIVNGPVLVLAGMLVLAFSAPRYAQGDWTVLSFICLGLTLVGFGIGLGWVGRTY